MPPEGELDGADSDEAGGADVGGVMLVWAFSRMNAIARRRVAGWASWRPSMVGSVSALLEKTASAVAMSRRVAVAANRGCPAGPGWAWAVSRTSV